MLVTSVLSKNTMTAPQRGGGERGKRGERADARKWTPGTRTQSPSVTAAVGENGKRQGLRPPRAARQTKAPPQQTLSAHPRREEEPTRKAKQDNERGPRPADAASFLDTITTTGGSITLRCWDTGHCIRPSTHPRIYGTNELPVTVARRQQRSLAGVGRPACRMVCNRGPGWRCVAERFAPV